MPAEIAFAQHENLGFAEKWRDDLGADPNPRRKDAVDFAHLATQRFKIESIIGQPYVRSIAEIGDYIARDSKCEIAGFALLKCDWFPYSEVIGICHFRRTWSNNIVLDYLASHPFAMNPPKDDRYKVRGVGTTLLVFLCRVAAQHACGRIWGEATDNSCDFYKEMFKLDPVRNPVQDLFLIPPQNFLEANTMKPDALEEIYKVEETNPPLVGKRSVMFGSKRQLVNHFLDLQRHDQDQIAQALGLHEEGDSDILEDQWCRVLFQRADQNGKLRELWDEVEKRHQSGEPEKNPFIR